MINKYILMIFITFILTTLSGCTPIQNTPLAKNTINTAKNNPITKKREDVDTKTNNKIIVQTNLNDLISDISVQLRKSTRLEKSDTGLIAITSFVNLRKFDKTNKMGRFLSESMFAELFVQGFNVSDFRGKDAILINKDGEFYISRDINQIDNEVPNTYVLVGTYTNIKDKTYINVRIMDNISGKLVASARAIYKEKEEIITKKTIKTIVKKEKKRIKIKGSAQTIALLN